MFSKIKQNASVFAILCFTICSLLLSCTSNEGNDIPGIDEFEYTSVLFDEASIAILTDYAKANNPWNATDDITYSCNHMTIHHYLHEDNIGAWDWCMEHVGDTIDLRATTVGYTDHCFAMEIETDIPVTSGVPHTTLIVNNTNGGEAWESKLIENWKPLDKEIKLRGVVTFHRRK